MAFDTLTEKLTNSQSFRGEIWVVSAVEPRLLVSNFGRVVGQPSYAPIPNGGFRAYLPKPTFGYVVAASTLTSHTYRNLVLRGKTYKVHSLICAAFHGPRPLGAVVIHIDEDAHNNRSKNLRWGTQKENMNMPKIKAYHRSRVGDMSAGAQGKQKRLGAAK